MKNYLQIILSGIICLFVSCQLDKSTQRESDPAKYNDGRLYVSNTIYELGQIEKTTTHIFNYSFTFKNISDTILTIESVEALCSCISINEYKSSLYPKDSTIISGEVDISNQIGNINKPIFIRYNCGKTKTMLLRIKALVK